MRLARAVLQLTRLDSSFLAFLSVLIPVLSRTNNLTTSLGRAVPLLLVAMCTFILNDLDDLEKDKINHPTRPLPSGQVKPSFVAVLYYICLTLALFTTRFFVTNSHAAFWYYSLLIISISYSYIVEFLPEFKSVYVAGAASVPVMILVAYYPHDYRLYSVAVAVFLFTLGRELCMDLRDRPGDPVSFLHSIEPRLVARFAFTSQATGLFLLSLKIDDLGRFLALFLMAILLVLSFLSWFKLHRLKAATALMKAVVFCGLYFLL